MPIVLNTNVVVSGLLNAFGPSGQIVRLVAVGNLDLCYDARILTEYRQVLLRPKFRFERRLVEVFLQQIQSGGVDVLARPLALTLPDSDDAMFMEVAVAGRASHLVTGNLKHYPLSLTSAFRVVSPREFVDELARSEE
ncbi:MAG TPA: putative toxin-antitoxin system toxin component, PIN family [Thermoanaerobaculia bacterium]|nr:putative toxin-antitoxin system toxin component, PIN family [Thermoanaerobaculia bacterium]